MKLQVGDRVVVNSLCVERSWIGLEGTVVRLLGESVVTAKMDKKELGWVSERGHLSLSANKWDLAETPSYIPEDWS